jgi:hypothetical protein
MVTVDRMREQKEFFSSQYYRLKEYAAFPLFIIFIFLVISGTLTFASFYAVSYSYLIILAPLLLFLLIPPFLKASFYFTIFHPRILIEEEYLTLPKKMIYSRPYVKIRVRDLSYMSLITRNYKEDGIFNHYFDPKTRERFGDTDDIDSLEEMDKDKLQRIRIVYRSNNKWGGGSVEIPGEFFKNRNEFLEFVSIMLELKLVPRKHLEREPTKDVKKLIEVMNRVEGVENVAFPETDTIWEDRFMNRIMTKRNIAIMMISLFVGGLPFGIGLGSGFFPVWILGLTLMVPGLIFFIFILFTSLWITLFISGFRNVNWASRIGISDFGLFFYNDRTGRDDPKDYVVPWKYVDRVVYSRSIKSYFVIQEIALRKFDEGMMPWPGLECFIFTNKDIETTLLSYLEMNSIELRRTP